ncbi:MAG: hypothetical protein LQ338_007699 [Usnochroma carphineum]|nr:MAG: hypothetical protein LQ338_007699 [Usnochroma carphineum]
MPQRPSSRDPPVLSAANLDTIKAKLNIEIDAPTSSAALSSGPSFEFDIEDGNSSSSLSSAPEVEELDFEQFNQEWRKDHPPTSPKKRCPICEDLVSRLFMEEFSGSAILSVRQQQKFCRAHKVRSAEETWRANGYPSIDWFQFAKRLQNYGAALGAVLNGTRTSFYRNAFEDQIKSGANRTLQQAMSHGKALEGLDMGYYGTKGGRIMMDHIMSNFASRIRKLAGTEKLVSAAGVSGFVQAVLAPELAVMLVKDDMQVDEEQARVILKESSDIGHLLNEEEDEAIKDEEERETLELE